MKTVNIEEILEQEAMKQYLTEQKIYTLPQRWAYRVGKVFSGKGKVALVDIWGNITYSLFTGTLLDYSAGLSIGGILASRTSATGINALTGGVYGWWREKVFQVTKTNENSSKIKNGLTDLIAFNTFQVPVYAAAVSLGSLASEGEVDLEKVKEGAKNLVMISPLIGPTLGMYMDWVRKRWGIEPAAKGTYQK